MTIERGVELPTRQAQTEGTTPARKPAAHAEALEVPRVRFVEGWGEETKPPVTLERPRWAPEPEHELEPETPKVTVDPVERMKVFNATTGAILAQAYEVFPEMTTSIPNVHGPRAGVDSDFYRSNLKWLESEGYIRFHDPGISPSGPQADYRLYTLTGKGLGILSGTPASLKAHGESIGEAMVGAAKKGAKDGLQALAKEALKEGFGLAARFAMEHMKHGG